VLLRMFEKRLKTYKMMGYDINENPEESQKSKMDLFPVED
jgi:hypothetical protein